MNEEVKDSESEFLISEFSEIKVWETTIAIKTEGKTFLSQLFITR